MSTPFVNQPAYQDGDYSTPVPISRTPREYPFAHLGDIDSVIYSRTYAIDAAAYVPRVGVSSAYENLALQSVDFASPWTATRTALSTDGTLSPFGTATVLTEDTSSLTTHQLTQTLTQTAAAHTYTLSVHARIRQRFSLRLIIGNFSLNPYGLADFDLTTGTVTQTAAGSGSDYVIRSAAIKRIDADWYRCWITVTTGSDTTIAFGIRMLNASGLFSYTGDGTSGIYLAAPQLVEAIVPGDYVATASTSAIGPPSLDIDTERDAAPLAYLIRESRLDIAQGVHARLTRTFATLPTTQTDHSRTIMVTKPSPGSDSYPANIGSYLVTKPDANLDLYDAYFRQSVTADSGIPSSVTGGTYTVTFGANTTPSQSYNASAATLQSALNALASVAAYGSVAVTGSYTAGFAVTWAAYSSIGFGLGSMVPSDYIAGIESFISSTSRAVVIRATTPTHAASIDLGGITAYPKSSVITGSGASGVYTVSISAGSSILYDFFNLTVESYTTSAIPCGSSTSQVETILNALFPGANFSVYSSGNSKYGYIYSEDYTAVNFKFVRNNVITGGTYTLTVLGQTTASIAYNASLATIASSINALSNVTARGGVTLTGTGFASGIISFTLTYASIPAFTASSASLTPSPATITIASQSSGFVQSLVFSTLITYRLLAIPNHGLSGNEYLYAKAGSNYYYGFLWNLIGPDQITVDPFSAPFNSATPVTEIGARTKQNYSPGTAPVRCTLETRFSLTSIDPATYQGDTAALLAAIFAGTGTINYRVGDATRWPDDASPMLALTTTQVDASLL